jgi:hypothetical protein
LVKLLPPNAKDMGKEILASSMKSSKWLQGQIFGFFIAAISFRFMDSRITTHTQF